MNLNEIDAYEVKRVRKDLVMEFGDMSDGAIEFAGLVEGGCIEVGYFYGHTKPKNIIVASSQVGCPSKCNFCELGSRIFIRDLTIEEIYEHIILMLQQARKYGHNIESVKHKINWSKSGDPLFNRNFVSALESLADIRFSHKVSTVFPAGNQIQERFKLLSDFASIYSSPVQIQISIISTSERYREKAAGIKTASFKEIRTSAEYWAKLNPNGRKINLSLILDENNPIDVDNVLMHFPPELFRFRFRNYVPTENGTRNGLCKISSEKFDAIYKAFQDRGYEVGTWATPTPIEQRFSLASNVTLRRYKQIVSGKM